MAKRRTQQGKLYSPGLNKNHSDFFKAILEWASPRGWIVEGHRSHRVKWRHKSGGIYFSQIFCEDTRGIKHVKAHMRRIEAGVEARSS